MKKLITIIALLILSMIASTAFALDEAEIKASDLSDELKIDFITQLSAASTDTSKTNPIEREFKKLSAEASKAKADAEEAERLDTMYKELGEFFKPKSIDDCIKGMPAYFLVKEIEPNDQHLCIDFATKRWSKMTGYELNSGNNDDGIGTRLTTLNDSYEQNKALDARISARLSTALTKAKESSQRFAMTGDLQLAAGLSILTKQVESLMANDARQDSVITKLRTDMDNIMDVQDIQGGNLQGMVNFLKTVPSNNKVNEDSERRLQTELRRTRPVRKDK